MGDSQNLIQKQTSFPYGIKISMKKHENLTLDFTLIRILMSIQMVEVKRFSPLFELRFKKINFSGVFG